LIERLPETETGGTCGGFEGRTWGRFAPYPKITRSSIAANRSRPS
jgi:hypothetical protein